MFSVRRSIETKNLQVSLVGIYGLLIFLGLMFISFLGWTTFWGNLRIPTMYPYFADLRTIQGAVIGASNGLNAQITNPNDPWGRPMVYPNIWIQIGHLLQIGDKNHFFVFGIFIVFSFLACGIHFLWRFPSIITLISFCSFSTLLGIERGNIDLLIFVLIYMSVLAQNKVFKIFAFVFSVILKIYPIFAIIALKAGRKLLIFVSAILIFYFSLIFDQFKLIYNGNSAGWAGGSLSYGFKTVSSFIIRLFNHPIGLTYNRLLWVVIFLLVIALVITLFLLRKVLLIPPQVISSMQAQRMELFLSGAAIYCGTFLFASNWDYRLIFLILCLPFLNEIQNAMFSKVLPIFFLVAMSVIPLSLMLPSFFVELITIGVKIAIFILLSYACFSILTYQILEHQAFKKFAGRLSKYLSPLGGSASSGQSL